MYTLSYYACVLLCLSQQLNYARDSSSISTNTSGSRVYWISFLDHLRRVVIFTQDKDMVECAKAGGVLTWVQRRIWDFVITVSLHIKAASH